MAPKVPTHIRVDGHLYRRASYSHLSQELASTAKQIATVTNLLHEFVKEADQGDVETIMTKGGTAGGSVHGRIQRMQAALNVAAKVISDQAAAIRENVDIRALPPSMAQLLNDIQQVAGYAKRDQKERDTVYPGYQWPKSDESDE